MLIFYAKMHLIFLLQYLHTITVNTKPHKEASNLITMQQPEISNPAYNQKLNSSLLKRILNALHNYDLNLKKLLSKFKKSNQIKNILKEADRKYMKRIKNYFIAYLKNHHQTNTFKSKQSFYFLESSSNQTNTFNSEQGFYSKQAWNQMFNSPISKKQNNLKIMESILENINKKTLFEIKANMAELFPEDPQSLLLIISDFPFIQSI